MIEIKGLSKTFQGKNGATEVLRGIDLSVRKGEIYGIIGRSGAGKSTLVRCVNLLERPTAGSIHVAGQEVTTLDGAALRQARRSIGMVFQHFNLLSSRTVFDNVAFPLELAGWDKTAIRERVLPLLDLVGLSDKHHRFPIALSGGEKQRVGIARALAPNPSVLLCDEATSALDPETTKSILALLKDINAKLGLTILLITHEMSVIKEICDGVAVLDHGDFVEKGSVFDVFTQPRSEVARSILRDVVDRQLPAHLKIRLKDGPPGPGEAAVLRIIFTGPSANLPVVAEMVRRHDVLLNILQADVDYIQGLPYGNMVLEASGADGVVETMIADIRNHNLRVEVLGHVVTAGH